MYRLQYGYMANASFHAFSAVFSQYFARSVPSGAFAPLQPAQSIGTVIVTSSPLTVTVVFAAAGIAGTNNAAAATSMPAATAVRLPTSPSDAHSDFGGA